MVICGFETGTSIWPGVRMEEQRTLDCSEDSTRELHTFSPYFDISLKALYQLLVLDLLRFSPVEKIGIINLHDRGK